LEPEEIAELLKIGSKKSKKTVYLAAGNINKPD